MSTKTKSNDPIDDKNRIVKMGLGSVCAHPSIKVPVFYRAVGLDLSSEEVRERWPRSEGVCSDCGSYVVAYASLEHQIAGDW